MLRKATNYIWRGTTFHRLKNTSEIYFGCFVLTMEISFTGWESKQRNSIHHKIAGLTIRFVF